MSALSSVARCVAVLLVLGLIGYVARPSESRSDLFSPSVDAILVLAGGVSNEGKPHETVMRRLREAARVYQSQIARSGAAPAVVCNGGGTTHKPKWVDPAGYAVPEAALMARELRAMGVKSSDIYVEGYSDDTIGNAFFARVMHADVRPWTNLLVVTSSFQMARTQAIYDWVFGLLPMPEQKRAYRLEYIAVADEGALPRAVLRSRRTREATSLRSFQAGTLIRLTELASVHEWINLQHKGYSASGMLMKRPLNKSSALALTY